jgi:hypothetical protein
MGHAKFFFEYGYYFEGGTSIKGLWLSCLLNKDGTSKFFFEYGYYFEGGTSIKGLWLGCLSNKDGTCLPWAASPPLGILISPRHPRLL